MTERVLVSVECGNGLLRRYADTARRPTHLGLLHPGYDEAPVVAGFRVFPDAGCKVTRQLPLLFPLVVDESWP